MIFSYNEMVKKSKNGNYEDGIQILAPIIKNYADTVNESYIDKILNNDDIDIILYCNNSKFNISNCIGFIIYTKTDNIVNLLLLCINKKNRKFGYGKVFLEEFISFCKRENIRKITLEPLENSINFYKTNGFIEVNKPETLILELNI